MDACGQGAHHWRSGRRHNLRSVVAVPAALVPYQTPIRLTSSVLPNEQIFAAAFSQLLSRRGREGALCPLRGGQVPWPSCTVTGALVRVTSLGRRQPRCDIHFQSFVLEV